MDESNVNDRKNWAWTFMGQSTKINTATSFAKLAMSKGSRADMRPCTQLRNAPEVDERQHGGDAAVELLQHADPQLRQQAKTPSVDKSYSTAQCTSRQKRSTPSQQPKQWGKRRAHQPATTTATPKATGLNRMAGSRATHAASLRMNQLHALQTAKGQQTRANLEVAR